MNDIINNTANTIALDTIEEGIEEIRAGRMLVVVDSPDRENQGDIIFSAQSTDLAKMNFILNECRGMICAPLSKKEAVRLGLPLMVRPMSATERTGVQFTVTVDAKDVEDFGISSADRVKTVLALANPNSTADDLHRPGHVFPLLARDGGVMERQGHTEATVDFCRLAGLAPVGVLAEILKENGDPARMADLAEFAKKHGLKMVSVEDLHEYVKTHPLPSMAAPTAVKTASATLPTRFGTFAISIYKTIPDDREHVLMQLGDAASGSANNSMSDPKKPVLVRVHSECKTGDTLFSERCDCRAQLEASMKAIGDEGSGILLYLDQEGRSIGLSNKIRAYALQEKGEDTVQANINLGLPVDAREYSMVKDMLSDIGVSSIRLLTNNPEKISALEKLGIHVAERVPLVTEVTPENSAYLSTKKTKLGHLLDQ